MKFTALLQQFKKKSFKDKYSLIIQKLMSQEIHTSVNFRVINDFIRS